MPAAIPAFSYVSQLFEIWVFRMPTVKPSFSFVLRLFVPWVFKDVRSQGYMNNELFSMPAVNPEFSYVSRLLKVELLRIPAAISSFPSASRLYECFQGCPQWILHIYVLQSYLKAEFLGMPAANLTCHLTSTRNLSQNFSIIWTSCMLTLTLSCIWFYFVRCYGMHAS